MKYIITSILIILIVGFYYSAQAATTVQVNAWGGGAAGRTAGAGGGGGGAYAGLSAFSITSGVGYSVVVGIGGQTNNASGATTTFNGSWPASTLIAAPGWRTSLTVPTDGGLGGAIASSTGDVIHAGGNGGNGVAGNGNGGGGGGGGGGETSNGGVGGNATPATCIGGSGGVGGTTNGGNGGDGASGAVTGQDGVIPGGGGGGGESSINCVLLANGKGANGQVIITSPLSQNVTATGGTHTTDATNDIWTFTTSGTWVPTFSGSAIPAQLKEVSGVMNIKSGKLILK